MPPGARMRRLGSGGSSPWQHALRARPVSPSRRSTSLEMVEDLLGHVPRSNHPDISIPPPTINTGQRIKAKRAFNQRRPLPSRTRRPRTDLPLPLSDQRHPKTRVRCQHPMVTHHVLIGRRYPHRQTREQRHRRQSQCPRPIRPGALHIIRHRRDSTVRVPFEYTQTLRRYRWSQNISAQALETHSVRRRDPLRSMNVKTGDLPHEPARTGRAFRSTATCARYPPMRRDPPPLDRYLRARLQTRRLLRRDHRATAP